MLQSFKGVTIFTKTNNNNNIVIKKVSHLFLLLLSLLILPIIVMPSTTLIKEIPIAAAAAACEHQTDKASKSSLPLLPDSPVSIQSSPMRPVDKIIQPQFTHSPQPKPVHRGLAKITTFFSALVPLFLIFPTKFNGVL